LLKRENVKITSTPIHVKVSKWDLIDLTLIDLPGLTYIKQEDIEYSDIIKEMISNHIQDPNCIILMVSPANADLGNSETVWISRDFDKEK